jgi:hypothetical protein
MRNWSLVLGSNRGYIASGNEVSPKGSSLESRKNQLQQRISRGGTTISYTTSDFTPNGSSLSTKRKIQNLTIRLFHHERGHVRKPSGDFSRESTNLATVVDLRKVAWSILVSQKHVKSDTVTLST